MSRKEDRINKIANIIRSQNGASVKELAKALSVSEMTIRRDLNTLNKSGIVKKLYGSTVYNSDNTIEHSINTPYLLNSAETSNFKEKNKIGKFAVSLIKDNDILIIDGGSTTACLSKNIKDDIPLKVFCYNSNIANDLINKSNIELTLAGGYFHKNSQMFESKEGLSLINSTRATKAFVSAAGIHETLGITCANNYEVEMKKAIIKSSCERILLIDSSKFSKVSSSYFSNLEDFNVIVTDEGISSEWKNLIEKYNIKLYIV